MVSFLHMILSEATVFDAIMKRSRKPVFGTIVPKVTSVDRLHQVLSDRRWSNVVRQGLKSGKIVPDQVATFLKLPEDLRNWIKTGRFGNYFLDKPPSPEDVVTKLSNGKEI